MASKDSRSWLATFLLVFLVIQGDHCKHFLAKRWNNRIKDISMNITNTTSSSKENLCKTFLNDTWNDMLKDILVNITAKIYLTEGTYYNSSVVKWKDRIKDILDNLTAKTSIVEGPLCNVSLEETMNARMKEALVYIMDDIKSPTEVNIYKSSLSGSWTDTLKDVLVSILGLIPPIGGIPVGQIISSLLTIFWPATGTDVWSLIQEQVEHLVDVKILKYELQERRNELRALQKTMEMYVNAQIKEKGSLMSTMIYASNELFFKLTQSDNSMQFIHMVVTHSLQHLLILKERLLHGKEMYGEDNTAVWRRELEQQISEYKAYIEKYYSKWVEWRKSQIKVNYDVNVIVIPVFPYQYYMPYGSCYDVITKESAMFFYENMLGPYYADYFKGICEAVKDNMFGVQNGDFLQTLVTTFYLDNFIPGNEDNPSVVPVSMSIASFGPLSPSVQVIRDENYKVYTPVNDNTRNGEIIEIKVRYSNIVNGFQVIYNTHSGQFVGNPTEGQLREIQLGNRRAKALTFCDNKCNIAEVSIDFSNGESTGPLGNQGGGPVTCVKTGGIDTYGLYNVRMAKGGCTSGLYQIGLDFKAYPTKPSEIDQHDLHLIDFTNRRYKSVLDD
ncbi:uncharacterized protein LOC143984478 [Lithobates pipiens]